jgi:hypothetical protein
MCHSDSQSISICVFNYILLHDVCLDFMPFDFSIPGGDDVMP